MSAEGEISPEQLFRILLDTVPCGVVHVGADGSIVTANAEALRILGFRFDELTERYVADFETTTIHEDGSPCPASEYPVSKALMTGEAQPAMTIGVCRPDGEVSWAVFRAKPILGPNGAVTGVVVSFVDITERKRAEDALRRSEEEWRTLAANHPDFVVVADREGTIQSINRVHSQFDHASVIGTKSSTYIHPDHVGSFERRFQETIATRKPAKLEARGQGPPGVTVWYELTFVPLPPQGNGPVERVLSVGRDVTVQREMFAKVAEHERLASIGMLSASVAHEIMNPLTYVLANLDFAMSDRCPPGPRMTAAIASAREGAARMQQTVHDLRMLGRSSGDSLLYVNVGAVLESALRIAGQEVAKNIDVAVELPPTPDVVASESRLCQVFINLLVNAAQSMVERPIGQREIRVRSSVDEARSLVGVAIADTGPGIPPEHLQRIFEPFFTTKPTGTGLGLSISKASVESMGGRLEVESRLGSGTTFTVWLSTSLAPKAAP